jgi:2-keto-4-pentenoate hydratase
MPSDTSTAARIVGHRLDLGPDLGTSNVLRHVPVGVETIRLEHEPVAASRADVAAHVAAVLGRDLTSTSPTMVDVLRAVEFLLPAVHLAAPDDDAVVLGSMPVGLAGLDLRLAGCTVHVNGGLAATGVAGRALGSPLHGLVWLSRQLTEAGTPLTVGDVVLLGAITPPVEVESAGHVEARIAGLGTVRARVAESATGEAAA